MTGARSQAPDPLAEFDGTVFLRNAVLFTRALRIGRGADRPRAARSTSPGR